MGSIDVLLINLPTTSWYKEQFAKNVSMPPLGLLYIGTVLKQSGYDVEVKDLMVETFTKDDFYKMLKDMNPKIIGLSTYNESWKAQKLLSNIIREVLPNSIIVAGGAFASFCYEDILNHTPTDYILRGEGDYSFLKLVDSILGKAEGCIENIGGIVLRRQDGTLYVNDMPDRITNLDLLPFPDRDLIDRSQYLVPFTISTARGCPGDCIFCSSRSFWGRGVSLRSSKSIFEEVMYLYNKYQMDIFYISDDTFTASPKRVKEFCNMLKETKISFFWGCESRADVITEELMNTLFEAGCRKLQIGLESADNDILNKLKKKVTIEQIENGISIAEKYGMHVSASFIVGHAFDTHETIQKTLNFAGYIQKKYGAYVMGSVNTPFPGTEQYENAEKLGIEILTDDWDNFRLNCPIINTENITREELRNYYEAVLDLMSHNNTTDEIIKNRKEEAV